MACTSHQGQLPGPVSRESGKGGREGRGTPSPPGGEGRGGTIPCPAAVCREGLLLTQALSCGKACSLAHTCVFGSGAWTAPSFLIGTHRLSAAERCVAPTSCQTERRCNVNSRVNPRLEFTLFTANFKVTGVVARAQGQIPKTPISPRGLDLTTSPLWPSVSSSINADVVVRN